MAKVLELVVDNNQTIQSLFGVNVRSAVYAKIILDRHSLTKQDIIAARMTGRATYYIEDIEKLLKAMKKHAKELKSG